MLLTLVVLLAAAARASGLKSRASGDALYPVGSVYKAKAKKSAVLSTALTTIRQLDISNNNVNGPNTVITNPIAINIYYGAAWTQAQRALMDLLTTNLGTSPLMSTVQTLKNSDGTVVSPLLFGGSFYDNVPDSTTNFGGAGQSSQSQIQTILQGYINAKSIGGVAFDVSKVDFKNTIFNIITSPQVVFSESGTCGYHSVMKLSSNPPTTTNDLTVLYSINAASVCNPFEGGYSNGQGGNAIITKTPPNDAGVDAVLHTLVHEIFETISDPMRDYNGKGTQSWYNNDDLHFKEENSPTFTAKGDNNENSDLCAWTFGLDPTQLFNTANANNVATTNANGNYEFNANIVIGGKYFLIPQNYVYSPPNSQCAMSAAAIAPLPAVDTNMALSFYNAINDPNEQFYLLVLYYTKVNTWQSVWKGPPAAYGKSVQFVKAFPAGTLFSGFRVVRASDNKIVAARDLFTGEQWTIDNINSWMVLLWKDGQNNYFAERYGTSGTFPTANVVAINAAYPLPQESNVQYPSLSAVDATNAVVTGSSYPGFGVSTFSINKNQPTVSRFFLAQQYALPVTGGVADISGYTFTCGQQGKETITATAPAGTTVAAGATAFVMCLDNPQMQAVLSVLTLPATSVLAPTAAPTTSAPSLPGAPAPTVAPTTAAPTRKPTTALPTAIGTGSTVRPTTARPTRRPTTARPSASPSTVSPSTTAPTTVAGAPTTSPTTAAPTAAPTVISTGYLAVTQYGESTCTTASQVTVYTTLGRCIRTGLSNTAVKTASNTGGVTAFFGTDFASTNCDPATTSTPLEPLGLDSTTVCQPQDLAASFVTASYAKALPPLPAGQLALYTYSSYATCAVSSAVGASSSVGVVAPLVTTYFAPTCDIYYGSAYQKELCAANVTVASSTGFMLQRFYASEGCQYAPLVTAFYQLNVCGQEQDVGSYMYVPKAAGRRATRFLKVSYTSNDCSGNPTKPSLSGTYYDEKVVSEGNTTQICVPSGLNNPSMAYVTVVYAPVLGFSSGWGKARFSSQAACGSLDTTKLFSGVQYADGCLQDSNTVSNYLTVGGCSSTIKAAPGASANAGSVILTGSQIFRGVSLAVAQSKQFQYNYLQLVATYTGLSYGNFRLKSVATKNYGASSCTCGASSSSGSGVEVIYEVITNAGSRAATNALLVNSGPVAAYGLAAIAPGVDAPAALACAPAPVCPVGDQSSATAGPSWATPGAIAGVAIGGAAAIALVALLSVFIPRMQHYQQAQVFGQGFANSWPNPQQQYPQMGSGSLPPGDFYSSPQQLEMGAQAGMQTGTARGAVVSF